MKLLILSGREVERCLAGAPLIEAMASAFKEVSARTAVMPVRLTIRLEQNSGLLSAMPAYLPGPQAFATKLVTAFANNPGRGLPLIMGVVVLNDAETGQPLAILDGTVITGLRTAAASALSTDLLANPNASTLAIIGSGLQARTHLDAIAAIRPLREVRVNARSLESAQRFVNSVNPAHPYAISAVTSAQDAVRGADIVVCATTAAEPVLRHDWLKAGAHLCAIGSHSPNKRELDSETVAGCAVIAADTREGCLAEADDVRVPIAEGRLGPERIVELGEILLGQAARRSSASDITLYKSVGMAAMDAAAARLAYHRAGMLQAGVEVDF